MIVKTLIAELRDDPLNRDYTSIIAGRPVANVAANNDVLADLQTKYSTRTRTTFTGVELFSGIDPTEFTALTLAEKQLILMACGISGDIPVGPGSNARRVFGVSSTTISNLAANMSESISRLEELGIPNAEAKHVRWARKELE